MTNTDMQLESLTVKNKVLWKNKDTVFILLSVFCGIMFADFALFGGFYVGFTAAYICLLIATTVYLGIRKVKFFPCLCGAVSVVASFIFVLTDDGLIRFLWFIAIFILYGIYTVSLGGLTLRQGYVLLIDSVITVLFVPFRFIARPFIALKDNMRNNEKTKSLAQIFLGLALAFPVIIVVVPLLISSDAAFEGLMKHIIGNFGEAVVKLFLGICFSITIFSLWFAFRSGSVALPQGRGISKKGILKLPAAVTMLSVMSVFYLAYLFSQLAYFFSAFSGILPKDYVFTAAEYARRGFFELCGVCFVNLLVLFLVSVTVKRTEKTLLPKSIKLLNVLICLFSLVFAAAAFSKMALYIERFGLTRLRLFTSVFMIFLCGVMICVIIKCFSIKFRYMRTIIVFGCVIGLLLGFANPDKVIAEYNISKYLNGELKTVDVEYIGSLSDAVVPELGKLLTADSDKDTVRKTYATLYLKLQNYYETQGYKIVDERSSNGFASYNVTRDKAKKFLYENSSDILRHKNSVKYLYDDGNREADFAD